MSYTASSSTISPRRSPATSTVPTIASGSLSGSAVRKTSTGLRRQNTSQSTSRSTSITPRPWVPASAGYIISPHLQLGEGTAARIFHLAHTEEPLQRDRAAALTGVSRATVNRSVISFLEAELLEEREDLTELGAVGRPALPVTVRTDTYAVLGIYIGRWTSSVTLHDLHGKILGGKYLHQGIATVEAPGSLLSDLEEAALYVLGYRDNRTVIWAGVAAEAVVSDDGIVNDSSVGWHDIAVGQYFAAGLGLPISLASHVEAMSAAELWNTSVDDVASSTLYIYARETLGIGQTYNSQVHHSATGSGTFEHLTAGPTTLLDPTGEGTVGSAVKDSAIVAAARAAGIPVETVPQLVAIAGDSNSKAQTEAKTILRERAVVLGEAVSSLVGLFNPTRVVLGGQAFTDYPDTLNLIASLIHQNSTDVDIRVTAARERVQQQAAAAVAITAVAYDPLHAVEGAR